MMMTWGSNMAGMHWYDRDGNSAYEVEGRNGKLRSTTLRDAKKLGLVPSVTTITSVQDKPGLFVWKQGQLLDACIQNPFHPFDDEKTWRKEILYRSDSVGRDAAMRGNQLHNALEAKILGQEIPKQEVKFVDPVMKYLETHFKDVEWITEESFTSLEYGFGGKVDLHSKKNNIVLDFKTKNTDDVKKMIANDDYHMQTAAYAKGLKLDTTYTKRYNLFISTKVPGLITLTESTDFERDWGMFYHLLKFWQLRNNYVPYKGEI